LTPIQIPNVPEGGKVPPGPGPTSNLEYTINRIEGNKVTLLAAIGVKNPRAHKVGERVKIHNGEITK
jgi:hypothetical protein